jgi:hypothetical protein
MNNIPKINTASKVLGGQKAIQSKNRIRMEDTKWRELKPK